VSWLTLFTENLARAVMAREIFTLVPVLIGVPEQLPNQTALNVKSPAKRDSNLKW